MSDNGEEYASVTQYDAEGQDEVELRDDELDDRVETEEVEVEVTDDEEEELGPATPATPLRSPAPAQRDVKGKKIVREVAASPASDKKQPLSAGKPGNRGKVVPSDQVKNMEMGSPQSHRLRNGTSITPDKNAFPAFGTWDPSTLSQIEICYPVLTGKNETTNELTRSTRPETRYWKAPIAFKYGNYTSDTMRFDNVYVLFHTGKAYGSSYVYICLPGYMGEAFRDAGKTRAPTKIVEASLIPDPQRWWEVANNVQESFGVINQQTRKFHKKSLETIFDASQSGISCSVTLKFNCKASTSETEALRPTTVRTVAVEVVRGFISEMDVNVQMPARVSREKAKVEPVATATDVATDDLMKRLADLGL